MSSNNTSVGIAQLNQYDAQQAFKWFSQACAAENWCQKMVENRPYANLNAMVTHAQTAWDSMAKSDFLQAFEAHPMIGDVNSLKAKFASTQQMAAHEQDGASNANDTTLQALHDLNHQYLAQNGFIFIICATGLSAETMLSALQSRIHNTREQEIAIAAAEQIKITLIRLEKNL